MAGEKLLTDAQCKAAKPKQKIYYLNDGNGLRLRVRPNGSKVWLLRYRLGSKEQTVSLGSYPTISLTIARAKADEARQLVATNQDPVIAKRIKRTRQASADAKPLVQLQEIISLTIKVIGLNHTTPAMKALLGAICFQI